MSRWDQEWTHIYSKGWISPPSPLHRTCSQSVHLSQSTCPLLCSKRLNVSFQTLTHRRQIMQMMWRPSTWREPLIKYLIRPKQNFERGEIRHSETFFFFHFRKYHNDLFIALFLCEPEGAGCLSSSQASSGKRQEKNNILCLVKYYI